MIKWQKNLNMVPHRIIPEYLSENECKELIEWYKLQTPNRVPVGKKNFDTEQKITDQGLEQTRINRLDYGYDPKIANFWESYLPANHWFKNRLEMYMDKVSIVDDRDIKSAWGPKVSSYDVGGHFVWHSDKDTDYDLYTVTIQLNNNYEGGEFELGIDHTGRKSVVQQEIHDIWSDLDKIKTFEALEKKVGTMMIYDSGQWHRVTPVTKGTRYCALAWFYGNNR